MKLENQFTIMIGVTMMVFVTSMIGAIFENIYVLISGIIILAIMIILVNLMPVEKDQVGFPEEII